MNKIFHYGIILFIIVGLIFNKQEAMLKALLQTPFDVFELCKTLIFKYLFMEWFIKNHSGFKYGESFKFSI